MSGTPGGGGSNGRTTPGHGDLMLAGTEQTLRDNEVTLEHTSVSAVGEFISAVQDSIAFKPEHSFEIQAAPGPAPRK